MSIKPGSNTHVFGGFSFIINEKKIGSTPDIETKTSIDGLFYFYEDFPLCQGVKYVY